MLGRKQIESILVYHVMKDCLTKYLQPPEDYEEGGFIFNYARQTVVTLPGGSGVKRPPGQGYYTMRNCVIM